MEKDSSAELALPSGATPAPTVGKAGTKPVMDIKAWSAFVDNFNKVQYLLDNNRLLLHEINLNQESKIPESLTRNIQLTRLLNDNISKVVELYSKISDTCETFGIQLNMWWTRSDQFLDKQHLKLGAVVVWFNKW